MGIKGNAMKCLHTNCAKKNEHILIDPRLAIIPAECEIGDLRRLLGYFQYRAPNIDSVHSPLLPAVGHNDVLDAMVAVLKNNDYCIFKAQNANTESALREVSLWENTVCDRCKRFMCKRMTLNAKRDPTRKETDLECLLRHMRNSIAHGHVYIFHAGSHITVCFEDVNKDHNTTARILCTQADLKKWKSILEKAIKDTET